MVLALGLLLPASMVMAPPVAAAAPVYYVDCSAGSDAAGGTTPAKAWRSLAKANSARLSAGSSLLLKRGCAWTGPLKASWVGTSASPITIGAYGSGAQPLIRNAHENLAITGSYLVIRDLATRADPTGRDTSCENWPTGYRVGFRFMSGAHHVTVRNSTASDQYIGVKVDAGAHDNRVYANVLRDNDMRDPNVGSDAGAVGVLLEGDRTEVSWNTISGSDACSPHYGRDGTAVEVYGGRDNSVHHNRASQNNAFTELGNPRSANNTFAYNEITSTLRYANVLVTRGASDKYGPVAGTKFHANTAYLTGLESYAIQCTNGCSASILSFRDNIIWANDRVGYSDASFDEGHNLYWRAGGSPKVYFATIASSSRMLDPRFVSTSSLDLRLTQGSPAVNAGDTTAVRLGFTTDLSKVAVPQGAAPDIGAREYRAPSTLALDTFARTTAGGWGSTSPGGAYRHAGSVSDYTVNGATGIMTVDPGHVAVSALAGVTARDTDTRVLVHVSRLARGTGDALFVVVRRTSSGNEYRLRVRLAPSGTVYLRGLRKVGSRTTGIGSEIRTGVKVAAGTRLWVRARVTGAGPTRLQLKVWRYGRAEPSGWAYSVRDAASALSGSGSVALRASLPSRSGGAVRFAFDNYRVLRP